MRGRPSRDPTKRKEAQAILAPFFDSLLYSPRLQMPFQVAMNFVETKQQIEAMDANIDAIREFVDQKNFDKAKEACVTIAHEYREEILSFFKEQWFMVLTDEYLDFIENENYPNKDEP